MLCRSVSIFSNLQFFQGIHNFLPLPALLILAPPDTSFKYFFRASSFICSLSGRHLHNLKALTLLFLFHFAPLSSAHHLTPPLSFGRRLSLTPARANTSSFPPRLPNHLRPLKRSLAQLRNKLALRHYTCRQSSGQQLGAKRFCSLPGSEHRLT